MVNKQPPNWMYKDEDVRAIARNIVNQLADTYHERIPHEDWVKVRQETNDMHDDFVTDLLYDLADNMFKAGLQLGTERKIG